jgi:fibronectin-binding autotransporter adhesin
LTGNGLNFVTNGAGALPQIVSNSSNSVTISAPLTLTNNLTVSGTGNVTLGGAIGGAGSLTVNSSGIVSLSNGNTYAGGTNVLSGTVQVAVDSSLGTGNVTGGPLGSVSFTGPTATTKAFAMNGGTIAVASGQTVTFNGSLVTGATLDGAGTFATNATNGGQFFDVVISPSVAITANSAKDQFVHVDSSAAFTVPAGINTTGTSTTVNLNGFTNEGVGSVTIGAGSRVNVANFQSYGMRTLTPAAGG